jgi:hypothetical protein
MNSVYFSWDEWRSNLIEVPSLESMRYTDGFNLKATPYAFIPFQDELGKTISFNRLRETNQRMFDTLKYRRKTNQYPFDNDACFVNKPLRGFTDYSSDSDSGSDSDSDSGSGSDDDEDDW